MLQQDGARWLLRERSASPTLASTISLGLVPALEKAIRIIALINARAGGLALPDISKATDVTRSHCHAILKTLVAQGWLAYDDRLKTYRLQTGILRDTSSILTTTNQLNLVRPILSRLAHEVGIPVVLSQPLVDGSFLTIDKFSTPHVVEVSFPVGFRAPRDAAAQMRANLAWRSKAEIERSLMRLGTKALHGSLPARQGHLAPGNSCNAPARLCAQRGRVYGRPDGIGIAYFRSRRPAVPHFQLRISDFDHGVQGAQGGVRHADGCA